MASYSLCRTKVRMNGRDPDHEYFSSVFPFENEQQPEERMTAAHFEMEKYTPGNTRSVCEIIHGLIMGNTRSTTKKSCFPSISILMRLVKGKSSRALPEDVVVEILRRLSPEHILICRMVCKRWMSLTSTPAFHLTPTPPVILLQNNAPNTVAKLYYLDLTHDKPRIVRFNTTRLHPSSGRCFYGGTCNGLVLLSRQETFGTLIVSIYNPFTGREITLWPVEADYFLGFWFHPTKRDYFFLTRSMSSEDRHLQLSFLFKIFNLRGESTVLGWYPDIPSSDLPINVNGSLYFFLTSLDPCRNPGYCVMIFNMEEEEFDFKGHPHDYHCTSGHGKINEDMWLLDLEGSLGFAHMCSTERCLCVWALEECATWKWIPRFKISINWHRSITGTIGVLSGTQKGEMVMHYCYRRLFAVNLETRRIRKIDLNIDFPIIFLTACTYVRSLVDPSSLAVST